MKAIVRTAVLVLFLLALPALAQKSQTQAKGFAADKVYQFGDVDHINLFNGNVTAVIPLGQRYTVSSALSYQFTLAYGGNDWEVFVNDYQNPDPAQPPFQFPYATPRINGNAGFAWNLAFTGRLHVSRTSIENFLYETPDGALHELTRTLHQCHQNVQIPCVEPVDPNVYYTSDGTYYRLKIVTEQVSEGETVMQKTFYDVSAPDGTITRFVKNIEAGSKRVTYPLDSIRDPFGNRVTVEYETLPDGSKTWWTIRDGHRTHIVEFINANIAFTALGYKGDPTRYTYVKKLTLAAAHGQQAIYTFDYGPSDVPTAMSRLWVENQDCNVGPKTRAPVLQQVLLPDGSNWQMTMDIGDGGTNYSRPAGAMGPCEGKASAIHAFSGSLLGLRLPTLGRLEWRYAEWFFPAVDPGGVCLDQTSGTNICNAVFSRSVGVRERIEWTKGSSPSQISRRRYENRWFLNPIATEIVTVTTMTRATPSASTLDQVFSKSRHYFALSNGDTPSVRKRGEYGLPYTSHAVAQNAVNADFPVPNPDPITTGGERFLSTILYDASDRIVRYGYVGYDGDDPKLVFGQESNRRQRAERIIFRDPVTGSNLHYTLSHSSDFDGVGHYRQTTTDGDAPGGGARTTTTHYNRASSEVDNSGRDTGTLPGNFILPSTDQPWILNTWSSQEVGEAGSGSTGDRMLAWFDRDTGFLNRTRTLAGSARGEYDLVTEFSHSGDGNVTREDYFGGDVTDEDTTAGFQPLNTTSPLATMNLGMRRYRIEHDYTRGVRSSTWYVDASNVPFSFKTLDLTIDPNTGFTTKSRDTAGLVTAFDYDTSGRLFSMSPPGVASTSYAYSLATATAPARVTITRSDTLQVVQFDDLGRVWRELARMPPARGANSPYLTMRETKYNPMGWKDSVSEVEKITPETNDASSLHDGFTPSKRTTYTGYDVFGRPASVTTPDGKATSFTYVGMKETARTVSIATAFNAPETNATTTERYDRHGRLASVTEPSGENGALVTTIYGYDESGRLRSVQTSIPNPPAPPIVPGPPPAPTFTTQTRLFGYDKRGFLLSETHPEKGISGDGTVTYGAYDARGHARSKQEGDAGTRFDLKFTFDAAERLTKVEELVPGSTSTRRVVKEFIFATANNGADQRNGKLLTATRHHHDSTLGNIAVTETYEYAGIGGQPSKRTTTVAGTAVIANRVFTMEQTYEPAHGAVASVTYPTCTGCPLVANQIISYAYKNGLLSEVNGFGSIHYAPNGLLSHVVHKAGLTTEVIVDTWTPDPSGMPRPGSISAAKGQQQAWSSGAYEYDGAGNIKQIGDRVYLYDGVSRLVYDGQHVPGSSSSGVQYLYDAFGNRTGETVSGCVTRPNGFPACWSSSVLTPEVATTTNRYRNGESWHAAYDEAGNLTHADGTDYGWDAVGTLRSRIRGTAATHYLYTASEERVGVVEFTNSIRQRTLWTLRGFGNQLLRTYTENANGAVSWTEDQVWRGVSILANISPSGSKHYTLDHLGSPRLVTDNSGTSFEQRFDAFGRGGATGAGALQFTAHERDSSPDGMMPLDYMHARYYSPALGRFLSFDPVIATEAKYKPRLWNQYAYVGNNPLAYLDPRGKERSAWQRFRDNFWNFYMGLEPGDEGYRGTPPPPPQPEVPDCPECARYGVTPDVTVVAQDPDPVTPNWQMPVTASETHFVTASGGVSSGVLGLSGSATIDRHSRLYIGLGPTIGTPGSSLSLMAGRMDRENPSPDHLNQLLSGGGWSVSGAYAHSVGRQWSGDIMDFNGRVAATQFGAGTPGAGLGWQYSFGPFQLPFTQPPQN